VRKPRELPLARQALPVLKVLFRNANVGCRDVCAFFKDLHNEVVDGMIKPADASSSVTFYVRLCDRV
jgi:hypothetical protein